MTAASLYVHIPFCRSKCAYCSFSSFPGREALFGRYVAAVQLELSVLPQRQAESPPLQTVFFGGGTPTVLPSGDLVAILAQAVERFGRTADAEISVEANPGTVDEPALAKLRAGGFTRLSLGVQSFSAQELRALGRRHSPQQAIGAFQAARRAGFTNISLDLMYGLPGQTVAGWRETLRTALALGPEHLSMYQLTIEDSTPFAVQLRRGQLLLPDEEEIVAMDDLNMALCREAGLELYEISNFAREGFRCRHNINYWQNNSYLAVGAGAVSCRGGVRERRLADPEEYCRRIETASGVVVEVEELDRDASFRETVIMGLRMTEGVSRARLRARFGLDPEQYYGAILSRLVERQLVELTATHLRVTSSGRLFSNMILAELV